MSELRQVFSSLKPKPWHYTNLFVLFRYNRRYTFAAAAGLLIDWILPFGSFPLITTSRIPAMEELPA